MPLLQLIYVSRARRPMAVNEIVQLAAHSAVKNTAADISGALLSVGPYFMQLLEGDSAAIAALYAHIAKDRRHTDVQQLISKPISKRLFPQWGMRLLDSESTATLDLDRLHRLIEEFSIHRNTGTRNVEARVLLDDFKRQLQDAA